MKNTILEKYTKDDLQYIVNTSSSFTEVCKRMGYKSVSGNVRHCVKRRLCDLDVDISHLKNTSQTEFNKPCDINDVFKKDSSVSHSTLRRYYLKGNYTKYECSICGLQPIWNGKSLVLTLDHIDGDNTNNELINLRWICPNCDRQLPTYSGRNAVHLKKQTYCIACGKKISKKSKYCKSCFNKIISVNQPRKFDIDRDVLKNKIRAMSFSRIGQEYNVSDNAIRKLCKKYGLPFRKNEINSITDFDWDNL